MLLHSWQSVRAIRAWGSPPSRQTPWLSSSRHPPESKDSSFKTRDVHLDENRDKEMKKQNEKKSMKMVRCHTSYSTTLAWRCCSCILFGFSCSGYCNLFLFRHLGSAWLCSTSVWLPETDPQGEGSRFQWKFADKLRQHLGTQAIPATFHRYDSLPPVDTWQLKLHRCFHWFTSAG